MGDISGTNQDGECVRKEVSEKSLLYLETGCP